MIEIKNLHKYFNKGKSNEIHVINDISLTLPEKGMVAIFGKSGCGKTTLLNVIGGLDKFASGDIVVNNEKLTSSSSDEIRNNNIGYIFQNYCLNLNDSVLDNVAASLKISGLKDNIEIKDRCIKALESVGMDKYLRRKAGELSGGQQQRVAIARAIVNGSKIILADEPTGNLDSENTIVVMNILKEISKNKLVVLVTHEEEIAKSYADEIIQLVDGKVVSKDKNQSVGQINIDSSNNIYLNELSKNIIQDNGICIEYYGDILDNTTHLIIVNKDNQLYIKPINKDARVLDKDSEIKLIEKRPIKKEEIQSNDQVVNFEQINSTKKGKLYTFKKSFIDGARFTIGKKQKGQKVFRFIFSIFAVIMVFLSANLGSYIYRVKDEISKVNKNEIYISATSNADDVINSMQEIIDSNLGEFGYFYRGAINYLNTIHLNLGKFESTQGNSFTTISFEAKYVSNELIKDKSYVCGKSPTYNNEIVITTAVANKIIKSSSVSFISKYEDLLNIETSLGDGEFIINDVAVTTSKLRIVGIVQSNNYEVYVDNTFLAKNTTQQLYAENMSNYFTYSISCASDYVKYKELNIERGKAVALVSDESIAPNIGDSFIIRHYESMENLYNVTIQDVIIDSTMGNSCLLMNKEDYLEFLKLNPAYFYSIYNYDELYNNYFVIYESNAAKRDEIISSLMKNDNIKVARYEETIEYITNDIKNEILFKVIILLIIMVVLFISIFFIMRTALFSRIKEVGIARAIGVRKSNLIYKFYVESLSIVALIIAVMHIITSIVIWFFMSLNIEVYSMFYLPAWLFILSLLIEIIVISFAAILPVLTLLRKTPSEILAKYDI